jgi:hypothetical protein
MTAPNMRLCASWADEYGQSTSVILMIFCNLAVIKKVIPKGSLWDGQASDRNSNSQSSQSPDRWLQCLDTMKTFIAITLFLTTSCINNQSVFSNQVEGAKTDNEGNCFINTAEIPEADGINMDVYYPCSWSEVHIDNYHSNVIKQIGDTPQGLKANIALVIMTSKLKDTLTNELLDSLRSEIYLTGNSKLEEGTISTDTLEISGLKGGKIVTRNVLESGQIAYGLNIHLYSKTKVIQFRYVVGAPTEIEAASYFHKMEPILMRLTRKTRFHNNVL